jgi:hypothetical protein
MRPASTRRGAIDPKSESPMIGDFDPGDRRWSAGDAGNPLRFNM